MTQKQFEQRANSLIEIEQYKMVEGLIIKARALRLSTVEVVSLLDAHYLFQKELEKMGK